MRRPADLKDTGRMKQSGERRPSKFSREKKFNCLENFFIASQTHQLPYFISKQKGRRLGGEQTLLCFILGQWYPTCDNPFGKPVSKIFIYITRLLAVAKLQL